MTPSPQIERFQPPWRLVLAKLRRGPAPAAQLHSLIKRERPEADPLAAIRFLKRRGFVVGDALAGFRITLSGVGALAVTRAYRRRSASGALAALGSRVRRGA